jgi:hypothetical protein
MLFDDKIDVVVGNTDALPSCAGLDIDKIEEFQRGFFACAEHPLCGKEIVTTDDLAAYPVGATYPLPQVVIKTSSVRTASVPSTRSFASPRTITTLSSS